MDIVWVMGAGMAIEPGVAAMMNTTATNRLINARNGDAFDRMFVI